MTINHIEVIRSYDKGLLRAVFSATIDNCLTIVGIKHTRSYQKVCFASMQEKQAWSI